VEQDPGRREDGQRRCIRNAVVGLHELDAEAPQVNGLPVLYHFSLGGLEKIVFL